MKSAFRRVALCVFGALSLVSPHAAAEDPPAWLTRCARELGGGNDAETAKYLFETRGKAADAQGRAEMDFSTRGSGTATLYPTDAKDLMNPYGGASIGVGYYGLVDAKAPHAVTPKVGHVSLGAIGKDFKPIPGNVQVKLIIDGKAFGPYDPKASSLSSGQYSVWLDTADTDGDSAPPRLAPAAFAVLAKAVDAMSSAELVMVRDGVDVARLPVSLKQYAPWRAGLPKWAAETLPKVAGGFCSGSDRVVN
jgi:hypothetical protein